MPIHKEGTGYQWGNHGKVYPTKAGAARQAAAAHANGFTGDGTQNLRKQIEGLEQLLKNKSGRSK